MQVLQTAGCWLTVDTSEEDGDGAMGCMLCALEQCHDLPRAATPGRVPAGGGLGILHHPQCLFPALKSPTFGMLLPKVAHRFSSYTHFSWTEFAFLQ